MQIMTMQTPSPQIMADIDIRQGIPEGMRAEAARLYAGVFAVKYRTLIGSGPRAERIIAASLCLSQSFAALHQGRLVGLAGYNRHNAHFLTLGVAVLIREFGLLPGLWRFFLHVCQRKRLPRRELLIDGIVVADDWRGRGLGSLLIERLAHLAQLRGLAGLRLGVVDTNPRARQLYERLGFVLLETRYYRLLRGWIPFTSLLVMRLPLPPLPGIRAARPLRRPVLAIHGLVRRLRPRAQIVVWNPPRSV